MVSLFSSNMPDIAYVAVELVLWHLDQSTHQIKHFNYTFDSFNILAGLNLGGFILGGSNVLRVTPYMGKSHTC